MKGRSLFYTAFILLVTGIIFILIRTSLTARGIIIAGGIAFVVVGLMNLMSMLGSRRTIRDTQERLANATDRNEVKNLQKKTRHQGPGRSGIATLLTWFTSIGAILLGVILLLFSTSFIHWVHYVFAVVVLACALFQFYLLAYGTRPLRLPAWFFIFPVILLGASIYLFTLNGNPDEVVINLATGISLIFFAAVMLVEGIMVGSFNRARMREAAEKDSASAPDEHPYASHAIEDVSAKEVKD